VAEPSDPIVTQTTFAIEATHLGKAYHAAGSPLQRLRAALFRTPQTTPAFWALRDLSLQIPRGEALGVIGRNGAGKSTLLQLLCGTLSPTTGSVHVNGRIAALLELGAGFNPDFTGRENLRLNGPLLGLGKDELEDRLESIIAFSGIGHFVDQPVKTYSSGMFVRLAFSLATSVDPDILVVDEALSVGDGEFSRKSFDRIHELKEKGTTILFCSHALYQVEAFCNRVMWLHGGKVQAIGEPHEVVRQYDLFLASEAQEPGGAAPAVAAAPAADEAVVATPGHARISSVRVSADGVASTTLKVRPGETTVRVDIEFESDPALPPPSAGITIDLPIGMALTCAVARTDGVVLERDSHGRGTACVEFPAIALRKGEYHVGVYLGHENAVHLYDSALQVATLRVEDRLPEPGLVHLPHRWLCHPGHVQ